MGENLLRGAVYSKFGSCTKLAEIIGWSGRKTRDIVSGRQIPTAKDIQELATALGIANKPNEFMHIFFAKSKQNVDLSQQ